MLPSRYVDEIFTRMLVRYGAQWMRQWPEGVDMGAVKTDWARELDRVSPESLGYALDNLPADYPPNVAQFKALCISRPPPDFKALPPPKVNKELAAKVLKTIAGTKPSVKKPGEWAAALRAREEAGERLTPAQRAAWRGALEQAPVNTVAVIGDFKPVPREAWPEAMRGGA